jgi:carbonic anhydrase
LVIVIGFNDIPGRQNCFFLEPWLLISISKEATMVRVILILFAMLLQMTTALFAQGHVSSISADKALTLLKEGNERFIGGKRTYSHLDTLRLKEVAARGQHPYAAIFSCSDSRVPVEHIFDAGIGDLFVLRDAGNAPGVTEIATLEYAALHIGIPLIVVMGHTKCGAITAATEDLELEGSLLELVGMLKPAITRIRAEKPELKGEGLIEAAIIENVRLAIEDIGNKSPQIAELVREGRVHIVGAYYDLESGKVSWLDERAPVATPCR